MHYFVAIKNFKNLYFLRLVSRIFGRSQHFVANRTYIAILELRHMMHWCHKENLGIKILWFSKRYLHSKDFFLKTLVGLWLSRRFENFTFLDEPFFFLFSFTDSVMLLLPFEYKFKNINKIMCDKRGGLKIKRGSWKFRGTRRRGPRRAPVRLSNISRLFYSNLFIFQFLYTFLG